MTASRNSDESDIIPVNRTSERLLLIGCKSFAGIHAVSWEDQEIPNIPDYDTVVVSVPHITKDFLANSDGTSFEKMRTALVRFLNSKGKLVVIAVPRI